jgi:hypothetical protein
MGIAFSRRAEPDRVRRYTSQRQLRRIDAAMESRLQLYASASPNVIQDRIDELRREWSIERYLQLNVSAVGLATIALAATTDRKWGWVTCAGLGFFLFHALEGFDPPLPALRRFGIRTRAEIDREIYALKVMRGDFAGIGERGVSRAQDTENALRAVGL